MMTQEQTLVAWLTVLFLTVGLFFLFDWCRERCRKRPDPLAPGGEVGCDEPVYRAERFSIRRMR